MKTCFMFGHATAGYALLPKLTEAAERHYLEYGVRRFTVGNRGAFDQMAATAVKTLKKKYHDISFRLLLAYHPAERPVDLTEGFDGSYYPPLENVPRKYAIVRANRHMVENADTIICYAAHPGNARTLLDYAKKCSHSPITNLANESCSQGNDD